MGVQDNFDLHYWITRSMGKRMGVNLSDAMRDGRLTQADFAEMITACRTCGRSEFCLALLSERGEEPNVLPNDCPNKSALDSLRSLH
ncbi:DUF6455 family protein [uncultured Thioclava sp.]|uniref:DUF6455 family protein n=1 Tax=uncultured Thioclava sp. TaxID=473858 RepID=UPI0025EED984|nr:DUF6455 family protein [uncultured Thioclava sp.]